MTCVYLLFGPLTQQKQVAVPTNWGVLLVAVLMRPAPLFGAPTTVCFGTLKPHVGGTLGVEGHRI